MTAKPPVPSKPPFPGVEAIREALRELIPEGLDVDNCEAGYIVGYSRGFTATQTVARLEAEVAELNVKLECAESCLAENIAQRNDADARANRLEAEVAELRELVEDMRGRAESKLHQAADALQDQVLGRLPRRTPELTERVARLIYEIKYPARQDWDSMQDEKRDDFRHYARLLFDLVLGKEPRRVCAGSLYCDREDTMRVQVSPTEWRHLCPEHVNIYGKEPSDETS